MKILTEKLNINIKDKIIDLAFSTANNHIIYAITNQLDVLKIEIPSSQIIQHTKIKKGKIDINSQINIKISPRDQYISITNQLGQHGGLYDMKSGNLIMELDRNNYHSEQSTFPIEFIEQKNKILLIHGSDWNHLNITDIQDKKLLTQRINKYQSDFYLDYFYGELHLSPNKENILSSGWVWGPASVLKIINLNNWLNHNINEPETNHTNSYTIMSYYWDRALCWIDDQTIAFLYNPKEEGLDEEDCDEMNVNLKNSYIFFYDLKKSEIIKSIVFNEYPKNEYHEATSDCKLFFDGNIIFSSESTGIIILNLEGKKLFQNNEICLNQYSSEFNLFYSLKGNTIDISKIID